MNRPSSGVVMRARNSRATMRLGCMGRSSANASKRGWLLSWFCRVTMKMPGFSSLAISAMARFFKSLALPATIPAEIVMPARIRQGASVPVPSMSTPGSP